MESGWNKVILLMNIEQLIFSYHVAFLSLLLFVNTDLVQYFEFALQLLDLI